MIFNRIQRYYLKLIVPLYIGSSIIFILLFLLGQVKYIISSIISTYLSFSLILKLLILSIPTQAFISLPVALVLANAILFGTLASSNEIIAIKSFGYKIEVFLKPVIFFSIIIIILTYVDLEYLHPYFRYKFLQEFNKYRIKTIESAIVEKKVSTFQNYKIYIDKKIEKDNKSIFKKIYIFEDLKGRRRVIYADEGFIDEKLKDKGYITLTLIKGYFFEILYDNKLVKIKSMSKTYFKVMNLFFKYTESSVKLTMYEKSIPALIKEMNIVIKNNKEIEKKLKEKGINVEKLKTIDRLKYGIKNTRIYEKIIHFKIGLLLSCFIFAFTGFSIAKGFNNLNMGIALFIAIVVITLFYIIFVVFTNYLLNKSTISVALAYYSTLIMLSLISIVLYIKGRKN